MDENIKPVQWMGSSYNDLRDFPDEVQGEVGFALDRAQRGLRADNTKILTGFRGASVLEIVENLQGDTYRAVYTVRFAEAVYVLHCFQKRSRRGSETPKPDVDLIKSRLTMAQALHEEHQENNR